MPVQIPRTAPVEAQRLVDEHGQRGWMALVERNGKTFRHGRQLVTCDPAIVRAVLMERPHVEKRPYAHKILAMFPGSPGVLFMEGEQWLTRARALAPVFHHGTVGAYAGMVSALATSHAEKWAAAGLVDDLYSAVQQLGAETVLEVGFGLDHSDPASVGLARALVLYKNRSMDSRPALRVDKFHVGFDTVVRLPQVVLRMWRDHAGVRRALKAALNSESKASVTGCVRRLQEAGLSPRALANEINHLYGAFNAVDYVITCGLWELGRRADLVTAIRAEIHQALGARAVPTRDDQARMPTFNGFILEILRRYPVTMGIARVLGAPLTVGGTTFVAGTQVLVLLHALHHHPEFWDDPWEIRPERWASPDPRVPFSYAPFLFGARKCLGRAMAEQQMLLTLSAVLRRFNIAVFADAVIPPFIIPRFAAPIPFSLDAV